MEQLCDLLMKVADAYFEKKDEQLKLLSRLVEATEKQAVILENFQNHDAALQTQTKITGSIRIDRW